MSTAFIIWVDDEIESLEAHRRFLEQKGYSLKTFTNGFDALEFIKHNPADLVLLDESMPGMSGLETLSGIKALYPRLPIVLVTKNETETLMDEAIGSQISDYIIKPVSPSQILLVLKKLLENKRLVSEKTTQRYQEQFRLLFDGAENATDHKTWTSVYRQLIFWELEMEKSSTDEMMDIHLSHKKEANRTFFKFISKNYASWIQAVDVNTPLLSHQLFQQKVLPMLSKGEPMIWLVIDNLRFDQWKSIEPTLSELFRINEEDCYFSILPTTTQYARNAIFSGLTPLEMEKKYPEKWKSDNDDDGKNNNEEFFLKQQLLAAGKRDIKMVYHKITNHSEAIKLADHAHNLLDNELSVIVYNFVDMLSHARTESEVLNELSIDEAAYRSLTVSWFNHSPLIQLLKKLVDKKINIVLCSDHGSIKVNNPIKVLADRQTTSNLRYKNGKNLDYNPREVLSFKDPTLAKLPKANMNSSFIFAGEQDFLCYPNNFAYHSNYFNNTFQHGGISMEEMIVPVVSMSSK